MTFPIFDPMRSTPCQSALAFICFAMSMGLFYLGVYSLERTDTQAFIFVFLGSAAALITSFALISRLRCRICGKKLEIEPFPSYNPILKFFLWTGADAQCGHCHEKI
jgi:hypothetical protein